MNTKTAYTNERVCTHTTSTLEPHILKHPIPVVDAAGFRQLALCHVTFHKTITSIKIAYFLEIYYSTQFQAPTLNGPMSFTPVVHCVHNVITNF
jgi:hypothetical protein